MKKLLISLIITFSFHLCVNAQNYSVNEVGELFVDGKKIASIKKTANGSIMATTVAEFTIYDVNNKPYLRSDKTNTKYLFLDDNKSYIPSPTDAKINGNFGIAQFIAKEKLFTPEGFNSNYRAEFIKKYRGYDASPSLAPSSNTSNRDRSASVNVEGPNIYQGNVIIGNSAFEGNLTTAFNTEIRDMNKKLIARIFFSEKDKYNSVKISIYLGNNSLPETTYQSTWSTSLLNEAVKWLVDKEYL